MATKIHQVLAVEKGIKRRTHDEISHLHHTVTREPLLTGQSRVYEKAQDDGEDLPNEGMPVRVKAKDVLANLEQTLTRLLDVTLTKDSANMEAQADIVVDAGIVLTDVPVSYLLFLEKQLTDLHTFFRKLPVLEAGVQWTWDEQQAAYRSEPVKTTRSKKVPRVLVRYEATDHHPAQTEVWHEDIIAGTWTTTRYSGALEQEHVDTLVKRVTELLDAVKKAREEANSIDAPARKAGEAIFDFLFRT